MTWAAGGLLATVLLAALWELISIWRAGPPAETAVIRLGPPVRGSTPQPIPRILWAYWHAPPLPELVRRCTDNWRRFAPDHELRLLDAGSAIAWLDSPSDRERFEAMQAVRQADWLRLHLLKIHGGIWIDASMLLAADLQWMHALREPAGLGLLGFYIERYTTEIERPIIENWFFAAPPRDPFLLLWADEFDRALAVGDVAYVEALKTSGTLTRVAQGIPESLQHYLLSHLAASQVSLRNPGAHAMTLVRAEDIAFCFHAALRWRKRHLYARLALLPEPRRVPALIKLRGNDRAVIERGLARGLWLRRSLLARLLELSR